jgi:hypothetical protein
LNPGKIDNMKKCLKRCPECLSSNIHKRSRILLASGGKRGKWVRMSAGRRERMTKYYKCYKCKYEFDAPLILEQQLEQIFE